MDFPFTHVPDVDRETLSRLDDKMLGLVCSVNRYATTICDDALWRRKLVRMLGGQDTDRLHYPGSMKQLYLYYKNIIDRGTPHSLEDALAVAVGNGHFDIVRLLINRRGVDPNGDYGGAIYAAARSGRLDIMMFLIDAGADSHIYGDTALVVAAENGRVNIVKFLLSAPINSDPSNKWYEENDEDYGDGYHEHTSPIEAAVESRNIVIVKLMIDYGTNLDGIRGNHALDIAVSNGDLDIIDLLLENGANPRLRRNKTLRTALDSDRYDILRILMDYVVV